jgi:hypothetical protein
MQAIQEAIAYFLNFQHQGKFYFKLRGTDSIDLYFIRPQQKYKIFIVKD